MVIRVYGNERVFAHLAGDLQREGLEVEVSSRPLEGRSVGLAIWEWASMRIIDRRFDGAMNRASDKANDVALRLLVRHVVTQLEKKYPALEVEE